MDRYTEWAIINTDNLESDTRLINAIQLSLDSLRISHVLLLDIIQAHLTQTDLFIFGAQEVLAKFYCPRK